MADCKARILVVDDHPMLRQGVVKLINLQPDMRVSGETGLPVEAVRMLDDADAMVLDLTLGHADGLALLKQAKALRPKFPTLVFSMHNEETFAERVLEAGADGYLMKSEPVEKVIAALRAILRGEIALSARMNTRLLKRALGRAEIPGDDPIAEKLSDRELHVFQQIGAGGMPTELAQGLGVSVKTVEAHMAHIKDKLGFQSTADLRSAAATWVASQ